VLQGCQIQTKILIWATFGGPLNGKKFVYSLSIWNILRTFGIFYGHLVIYLQFANPPPRFGILCQEKSGNPDVLATIHQTLSFQNSRTNVCGAVANIFHSPRIET
jgi:hypothetical protein